MNTSIATTVQLRCEIADEASFAPYGMLVRRPDNVAANLASGAVESWLLPFTSGSEPQIMFNRYHDKGREFSVMEKHLKVSQCFFPLGGVPYIMVVGKGSVEQQTVGPEDDSAFYVDGDCGVLLWQHVWHSLARFPVGAPYIDLAFITDLETQNEIERHLAGGVRPTQTEFIDFMQTHQTRFLVQDPQGPRS